MALESGPKNLEGLRTGTPQVMQEMPGAEEHDDVVREDLSGLEYEDDKEWI